jgi:hypothetical protein
MARRKDAQRDPELSFSRMIQRTRDFFALLPDRRKDSPNRTYKVLDALLSAFSVFFLQCGSFLNYQRTMQKAKERNNAQSLFGVHEIPSDNQIRNILETFSYQEITPLIADLGEDLYRSGALDSWRTPLGTFLGVLDGTTTISSDTISCSSCTHVKGKDGSVLHRHSVVTPILVSPGEGRVVALPPEFVTPQDGHAKQDCEIAASSRWLGTWGARYAPWKLTLLGDDLYAHQPFCRKVLSSGFDFLFVCKPSSHKILYEDIEGLAKTGALATIVHKRVEGVRKIRHFTDTYRFMNEVPIKDGADALKVNWLELVTTDEQGAVVFKNAWISSHRILKTNVATLALCARSRWKVENENNNVLKTKGYSLEHNFGHRGKNLANTLATLNILSFLLHTILEWSDETYRRLRGKGPRIGLFNKLKFATEYFFFDSWDALMQFLLGDDSLFDSG